MKFRMRSLGLEISRAARAARLGSQMVGFLGLKLSTSYVANLM